MLKFRNMDVNKKRLTTIVAILLCCMVTLMSSCNKSSRHDRDDEDDDEKVETFSHSAAKKMIDKHEAGKFTKADYSTCIDWLEEGYDCMYTQVKWCVEHSDNEDSFSKNVDRKIKPVQEKYSELDDIMRILSHADAEEMGPANYKRFNRIDEKFNKNMEKLEKKAAEKFNN